MNKDSKGKTFCLFYLMAVAFKSYSGKRLWIQLQELVILTI